MATFGSRLKHAWSAFTGANRFYDATSGPGSSNRPDRTKLRYSSERSLLASIYTRIGIDFTSIDIRHSRVDDEDRYQEEIQSGLNDCLTLEANIDQAASAFRLDAIMTLLDEGVIALVPVETTLNPNFTGSYDIQSMRVGNVVQWYPKKVRVSVYNENLGRRQEITLDKKIVGIVENPLYAIMNEPNSTLQRLIHKLNLLDQVDKASSSGKLDIIIQLPYTVKSDVRKQQAQQRTQDIEAQLSGSKYGIAYADATERITQLNRPAENQLLSQVQYLTTLLYTQLGLTDEVMNGTADEATMINYYNRTIEPLIRAVVEEMRRKFLTKTARTQGQTILYFRDPFKLVPISQVADIADKFTRNEIATSNEIRQAIGWKPSKDPKADQLVNSNMPQYDQSSHPAVADQNGTPIDQTQQDPNAQVDTSQPDAATQAAHDAEMNKIFDDLMAQIDQILGAG